MKTNDSSHYSALNPIYVNIIGFEGLYWINVSGEVKNRDGKILKTHQDRNGYHRIHLCKNASYTYFLLHRLIALHFIPNPENKPFINHKNGITFDNRIENLEWVTPIENVRHAFKTGLMSNGNGETHPACKFSNKDITEMIKLHGKMPKNKILKKFKISNSQFYNILKLNNYSHARRIFIRS